MNSARAMTEIAKNIESIKASIPENVTLVAVSKTKPIEAIKDAYEAGQRIFGENRVLELCDKYEALPSDIEWHMIGHLQTKKVKMIAPFVDLIHSVDSVRLLEEIDKHALKCNRRINCLLQFHIAQEQTKYGLSLSEALRMNEDGLFNKEGIKIVGVMGMATFVDDEAQVSNEFKQLSSIFDTLKQDVFKDDPSFNVCSMGMSGDYKIAIENGSNMIRVGSSIFGSRNYTK